MGKLNVVSVQWLLLSHPKNELLPEGVAGMNVGSIRLSETSQTQRNKHYVVSLTSGIGQD